MGGGRSPLSGSARTAAATMGAVTPAVPVIPSWPAAMGESRAALRRLPSTVSSDENSSPQRQREACRFSSSESGCDSETNAAKPAPVSVTMVPPRLGPPSGLTEEKTEGWTK
eukprot:2123762-Prymnesium_polylepis.2